MNFKKVAEEYRIALESSARILNGLNDEGKTTIDDFKDFGNALDFLFDANLKPKYHYWTDSFIDNEIVRRYKEIDNAIND